MGDDGNTFVGAGSQIWYKRLFQKSLVMYQILFDPPKSTPVAYGGDPQDRTGSP